MFKNLLIATDLSLASDGVVGCLKELRSLGAEKVLLLHCLGIRHLDEMKHLLLPAAEPRIREQKAVLAKQGFLVEAEITAGLPQFDINRVATEKDCSLIVVGTVGRTMTDEIRLGGVASEIIHHATKPVLLIRLKVSVTLNREQCEAKCKKMLDHVLFPTDFSDNAEHAFSYISEIFLGSVSHNVARHAPVSVLLIPAVR